MPEYLKELRRTHRYKQDFIASCLHITRQTYSHYETGRIKPPADKLYRLAKLYGVSVERMFACRENESLGTESLELEGAAEEISNKVQIKEIWGEEGVDCSQDTFLHYFRQLSDKDKIEIISLMKIKEIIGQ